MSHIDIASTRHAPLSQGSFYSRYGKRAADLIIAIALLPVLVPVIALLWLSIRSDGHPGLYAHTRVGRHGHRFRCWKLRTMVPDADTRLAGYLASNPDLRSEWDRTQKLQNDPRVTRIGRLLRRTSLDELPQIWNVICGDMSLVGPRPVTVEELGRYGLHRHLYLSLRPGVTGQWQIFGRANGCYIERLQLDRMYAATLGPVTDFALIVRTLAVLVRPTGR